MFSHGYSHPFLGLVSFAILLLLLITNVISSPVPDPPPSRAQTPNPTPPRAPVCSKSLGKPNYDDCDAAIALIPRDPRDAPVTRNFYVKPEDRSDTMPNVQLPFTETVGGCSVEILMASEFAGVPHDTAVWRDIWGPARTIRPRCSRQDGNGGIVTHNGVGRKMEIVVYATRSLYGLNVIIRRSTDPVARSIALQEFLDLIGLTVGPSPVEMNALAASLANNQTLTPALIALSKSTTSGNSTA